MTEIKTGYRKTMEGFYEGTVSVRENGKYLYKLNCDITRLNINDALFDAGQLKKDIEIENNLYEWNKIA